MNRALTALLSNLSYGGESQMGKESAGEGFVETLARVYEKARNALEYRADNLVRRAAIERILKRRVLINKDPKSLSVHLIKELRWARYLSLNELKNIEASTIEGILEKYTVFLDNSVPQDWVIKIASAEIDELFNINNDYSQFTFYAFQVLKQKVLLEDPNLDLLIFYATDKVYAGSDDEQILYHMLKLGGSPLTHEKLKEAWELFSLAKSHRYLTKITKFVRKQMPPLVLLRDIYFYDHQGFKKIVSEQAAFTNTADEVLDTQLTQMGERVKTAGVRSVIYVFLTKMIFAFGLEVPFEIFFYGSVGKLPLALNLIFPPILMWLTTSQIRLPIKKEKEALLERTWQILSKFEELKDEEDVLAAEETGVRRGLFYWIFTVLYFIFFFGVFGLIFFVLGEIGYTLFSMAIFVFFLTVIAFFAYRIVQIAKTYTWQAPGTGGTSFISIISLPILAIGSRLSKGLSKLNFLAFAFDFILEAPFKIILGFVDGWVQFISVKKEEEIVE